MAVEEVPVRVLVPELRMLENFVHRCFEGFDWFVIFEG